MTLNQMKQLVKEMVIHALKRTSEYVIEEAQANDEESQGSQRGNQSGNLLEGQLLQPLQDGRLLLG